MFCFNVDNTGVLYTAKGWLHIGYRERKAYAYTMFGCRYRETSLACMSNKALLILLWSVWIEGE